MKKIICLVSGFVLGLIVHAYGAPQTMKTQTTTLSNDVFSVSLNTGEYLVISTLNSDTSPKATLAQMQVPPGVSFSGFVNYGGTLK